MKKKKSYKKIKKDILIDELDQEMEQCLQFMGYEQLMGMDNPYPYLLEFHLGTTLAQKVKILIVPLSVIIDVICGKVKIELPPDIPSDALPLRVFEDASNNTMCILLRHDEFETIPFGHVVPRFPVKVIDVPVMKSSKLDSSSILERIYSYEREV